MHCDGLVIFYFFLLLLQKACSSADHFEELTRVISTFAPPVTLPWLSLVPSPAHGREGTEKRPTSTGKAGAVYSPLHVKRTKIRQNSKKNKKK
jgi:hypothetical protein